MIQIHPIDTPSLGDRSYLATDGAVAVVIDPQRDIDRVVSLAEELGVRVTHVAETHMHNDYVSGGLALAELLGAEYLVNADDPVAFARRAVSDGDVIETGAIRLRVVHTPGHTFTHLSYALEEVGGDVLGVFTGGSLLYGSTGRPDLLGHEHAETLAKHQHASAHRLARELPQDASVFPTHGFGSFCSATQAEGLASTIGKEAASNPALTEDEATYVERLLAGLDAFPAYYAHMGPANTAGAGPADLTLPAEADPAELRRRIDAGEWVVDLRHRTAFAAGHVPGTLSFALEGGSFITYLGWLIPWGTPVTLLGETIEDVAVAQRDLVRIGIDGPAAIATGKPEDWVGDGELGSYPVVTFADLAREREDGRTPFVLDVRRNDERSGGAIEGSYHIPLHELPSRLDEVPAGVAVWVHCVSGYRASIAAALLKRAGRDVAHIDDAYSAGS